MPRSREQYDDIRAQKKELILRVALELFAENGYHATSISQIAGKAKISKGLTYNYFESKKELLEEIISSGFNTIFENFDINHDGILSEEEFIYFIKQNFKLLRENIQYWKLFFSMLLQPSIADTFSKDYAEIVGPLFKMFLEFIASKGSKDPQGDLIAIASMLEGAFMYCIALPDIFRMDVMEEKIINACFKIINN